MYLNNCLPQTHLNYDKTGKIELENEIKYRTFCFNWLIENYWKFDKQFETCAMYALANKQYKTVQWLENHGSIVHKLLFYGRNDKDKAEYPKMNHEWARYMIDISLEDDQSVTNAYHW